MTILNILLRFLIKNVIKILKVILSVYNLLMMKLKTVLTILILGIIIFCGNHSLAICMQNTWTADG